MVVALTCLAVAILTYTLCGAFILTATSLFGAVQLLLLAIATFAVSVCRFGGWLLWTVLWIPLRSELHHSLREAVEAWSWVTWMVDRGLCMFSLILRGFVSFCGMVWMAVGGLWKLFCPPLILNAGATLWCWVTKAVILLFWNGPSRLGNLLSCLVLWGGRFLLLLGSHFLLGMQDGWLILLQPVVRVVVTSFVFIFHTILLPFYPKFTIMAAKMSYCFGFLVTVGLILSTAIFLWVLISSKCVIGL